MKLSDVKTLLKTLIQEKTPVTPMLWGRHGLGKSAIVREAAKEMGYRCLNVLLSQKEAIDVGGVLYTYEDKELGMSVTSSHPPDWFARALSKGKVVLFLDEFNMARREVLNAAFELVLDRRLNNRELPADVFIVCAGNPDDERYDVTPLSESLRDRLMHIQVKTETNEWLKWANNNVHSDIVNFIQKAPDAAYSLDSLDSKFPVEIKHSFRSWERVSVIHKLSLPSHIKMECYRGIVGPDLALAFVRSINGESPLTAREVIDGSGENQISAWLNPARLRMDLLTATANNVVQYCLESTDAREAEQVISFILQLPADLASSMINSLSKESKWAEKMVGNAKLKEKMLAIRAMVGAAKKKV